MSDKEQVERFLLQFHEKLKVFDIIYCDYRGKNQQTLEILEIPPIYRTVIISNLLPEDYVDGPIADTLYNKGDMWVFGKDVKGREVYIKLMLGDPGERTICISFHIAEHPMNYPFK